MSRYDNWLAAGYSEQDERMAAIERHAENTLGFWWDWDARLWMAESGESYTDEDIWEMIEGDYEDMMLDEVDRKLAERKEYG